MKDHNLEPEIAERKYNNEVEKDFVISQDPGEGRTIKENQIVKLIVSNGPKQIEMPS